MAAEAGNLEMLQYLLGNNDKKHIRKMLVSYYYEFPKTADAHQDEKGRRLIRPLDLAIAHNKMYVTTTVIK